MSKVSDPAGQEPAPIRQHVPDYSKKPLLVPTGLAKTVYEAFNNTVSKQPQTGKASTITRSILLQKGSTAKVVNVFVKAVLGKELHDELKNSLCEPFVDKLAEQMKKARPETGDKAAVSAGNSTLDPSQGSGDAAAVEGALSKVESDSESAKSSVLTNSESIPLNPAGIAGDKKTPLNEVDLKGSSSQEVAKAHVQAFPPTTTEQLPLPSGDGKKWHALRFKKGEPIEDKRVCTTSERALETSKDLTNIYVKISDNGQISITCGVIDSNVKADAFIAAVEWAQKERGPSSVPLRVSMHQLNSMGKGPGVFVAEKALVTRQHELVSYINQQLSPPNGPSVVSHTNRCLNGFTQIRGEDAKSHSINQEGSAQQMRWVFEDVGDGIRYIKGYDTYERTQQAVNKTLDTLQKNHTELLEKESENPKLEKELDKINREISKLIFNDPTDLGPQNPEDKTSYDNLIRKKEALEDTATEIKTLKNEIHTLEKQIEKQNKALCKAMHEVSQNVGKNDTKTKLELAVRVLASQTGMNKELKLEKLSPVQ